MSLEGGELNQFSPEEFVAAFHARVRTLLEAGGWRYVADAAVAGIEADFVVYASDDKSLVVLELKVLTSDRMQLASRSAYLASRLAEQANVRRILVVTPYPLEGKDQLETEGVRIVFAEDLPTVLVEELTLPPTIASGLAMAAIIAPAPRLFVAMPFDPSFDDVFYVAVAPAAQANGLRAYRVDQDDFTGDIPGRIREAIKASRVVVADLTGTRANVMYEMGVANGLGKPVIPISGEPLNLLPFDVRNDNTLAYEPGRTNKLQAPLTDRIAAALAESAL